ncbi:Phage-related baseplate assembly protein [Maioricimonas rarisocia]|uniref:Phage-related baseplate assembly protein n=1 Tax=Maioricimonas rarisocia TaxID=2528026 RepID=A0A517ZFJ2_9PLAN|nr:type VI secretion system tip protein TssI/VgrG [Maioricimonas rarisocia]QDU41257.1 Phage-related baseplate assembly protein [Maioricimonas rarisocia]
MFFSDPKFIQDNCDLLIDSPLDENDLLLTALDADEAISRPFQFSLGMLSEELSIDPEDLIGKPLSITVKPRKPDDGMLSLLFSKKEARFFHGIVSSFSAGVAVKREDSDARGFRVYHATLVPRLWFLSHSTNCRIFQEKTPLQIIETVLEEQGFRPRRDYSISDVRGPLAKRKWDYCVQYRESDLNFLSRLMEQLGIYYYFEHEDSGHTLVLTDKEQLSTDTIDVIYKPFSNIIDEDNQVTMWEHRYGFESGKVSTTDFDYRNSSTNLLASASSKKSDASRDYERFDYPGYYQTTKADQFGTTKDGKNIAEIHMQALDSQRHIIRGASVARELMPGLRIEMEYLGLDDEDGEKYLLTSLQHRYRQNVIPVMGRLGTTDYNNSFTCIPDRTPFRPPRVTQRPVVEGPQTAIVIGTKAFDAKTKSDQEVMTDKYGRVKVQFHWDRRQGDGEKPYENSSCWIRVSQGHSGAGWGMINIPRKGEEVIVDFIEGDPDQPIITGRVYNAQNKLPYRLDDDNEKDNIYISGFKTRSSPQGDVTKNYNELRFQDKKGKEHIYFHAERDFTRVVENKDVLIVSDEKEITQKRIDKVTKDTAKGSQTIEIYKNRTVTILSGDEKFNVDEGNRTVTIKKGNDHTEVEEGKRTAKISKGNDEIEVSKGDRIINVKKGEHKLDVAQDISITSGKNVDIQAGNNSITLKVGQSKIQMKSDGTITISGNKITLNGMKIALKGKQSVQIDAMQTVKIKALQKTKVEGTLGLELAGLKVDGKGQLMSTLKGGLMAEVKAGALAKVKGAITFVG